ncbi:MlaD family protein [Humitalea sp. 24SJ18S-53]|uniref:MlaD family protein n=1 Tax=Humitalea sp. 24SJ18S-53 TaxID=3422307 RepID=UPI003D66AE50
MAVNRRLYARVGALILVAGVLGIGFLLFLTSGRFSANTALFETYLRESVTGLDVGSPVRFRGVQVGRVTQLRLAGSLYPRPENRPRSEADDAAYRRVVVRFAIDPAALGSNAPTIEQAVAAGLRVKLASTGITGVMYIEADFVDPARFPVEPTPWIPQFTVIPSMPSTIAQVTSAAEAILTRIEAAPLDRILQDSAALVNDFRAMITTGDIAVVLREASTTLVGIREAIEKADLPGAVAEMRGLAADTRALVAGPEVRGAVQNSAAAAAELRAAMARLPAAIAQVEQAVRTIRVATSDTSADLAPLLRDLRGTAQNLRDTTETIRRTPSQGLWGSPPPPPTNRERTR